MRRQLGRVEQRVAVPHIENVINSERAVLEQMRQLTGDLKGFIIIKEIQVKRVYNYNNAL